MLFRERNTGVNQVAKRVYIYTDRVKLNILPAAILSIADDAMAAACAKIKCNNFVRSWV